MIDRIITHPGSAHKDDVLAVSLMVARYGVPVVRREPTLAELADTRTVVIDIGGIDDASKLNFDHHHFPREHPPTCSLSQVLEHLGLYEDALRFCDWLKPAEWFDSRGPKKTADWLGVPRHVISQLNSPIDVTLLRRFAAKTEWAAGDTIYEYMRLVGQDLLDYLQAIRERIASVAARVERWSIPLRGDASSQTDSIEVLALPRTEPRTEEASAGLGQYIRAEGLEHTIAAIVYPDRRGSGFGIARFEDHPSLDFSRVSEETDVHFAHASGFMCKTSATEPSRLQALISQAWMDRATDEN